MLTSTRFAIVLLTMTLLAAPAGHAAASKWVRLRTAHFELVGAVGRADLTAVAMRFEQFRETFSRLFPGRRQPAAPVVVVVFPTNQAFAPYMPRFNGRRVDVGGYFVNRQGVNYVALSLESGESAWRIVFHEYTHLLTAASLTDVPVWFDEGLSEFYSTFVAGDGGRTASLGHIVDMHISRLREQFMPLRELMAVRHDSPLYNEGDRLSIFYAESWALVHYLMMGKPEREPQLAKYLARYAAGEPDEAAFREAFGVDERVIERELREYVRRELFPSRTYTLDDPVQIDRTAIATPMSEAGGLAVLGDLLLQDARLDEAAPLLERARSLEPGLGRAAASLGRVRHLQSHDEEALTLLEEGVARGGDDYLPSYYLALTLLQPVKGPLAGLTPDREATVRGLALLEQVLAKEPNFAEAHALVGFGRLALGDRGAAIAALTRAHAISPRQEYALMIAEAHAANRDAAAARPILTTLLEHGRSDALRRRARDLLDRLAGASHER